MVKAGTPLFIWLGRNRPFQRFAKFAVKFFAIMFFLTMACTWAWDSFLFGQVYNCTDAVGFDYLHPGDWVHSWEEHPVVVVSKIVPPHDMSDPDTIKEGWSVAKLWCIWILLFVSSFIVSVIFARAPWSSTLRRLDKKLSRRAAISGSCWSF
jgi:hypothetical protein